MPTHRLIATLLAIVSTAGAVAAQADRIRINEVHPAEQWIELVNTGNEPVNVSAFMLCRFPSYFRVDDTTILNGSLTIQPGGFLVLQSSRFGRTDGEVGLYRPGTTNFGNASDMLDYVQYNTSGHQREEVAVQNGFWVAGETLGLPPDGQTLSRLNAAVFGPSNWATTSPTPGAANQTPTSSEEHPELVGFDLTAAYPNPFREASRFAVQVTRSQDVEVVLYDLLARKTRVMFNGPMRSGTPQVIDIDGSDLPAGTYLYVVRGEGFQATRSLVRAQ